MELVPELMQAGVACFKIEGRLKGPEYVALTTFAYRRAVDIVWHAHLEQQAQRQLEQHKQREWEERAEQHALQDSPQQHSPLDQRAERGALQDSTQQHSTQEEQRGSPGAVNTIDHHSIAYRDIDNWSIWVMSSASR